MTLALTLLFTLNVYRRLARSNRSIGAVALTNSRVLQIRSGNSRVTQV